MENQPYTTPDERWEAVTRRDLQADGYFFLAVITTGIYCRPTCPSKMPHRKNVRFFENRAQAEQAGFRPCKRCRPDSEIPPHHEAILAACRMLEQAETSPTLEEMAAAAGLSPYYFQRLFKQRVGVTPKQYAVQKRSNRVQTQLQENASVTGAVYAAGYTSSASFYSQAAGTLGMKPTTYRKGGVGQAIQFCVTSSYLGKILVAATATGICAIDFGDAPEELEERLRRRFPAAQLLAGDEAFSQRVAQVMAFLEHPQGRLNLPLDIQGTAFQRRVWAALGEIPAGSTASYAEVARRIGSPKAVRAVAQACAANKIAVAIPCHRVVQSGGGLGGYRWGVERKQKILEREKKLEKLRQ